LRFALQTPTHFHSTLDRSKKASHRNHGDDTSTTLVNPNTHDTTLRLSRRLPTIFTAQIKQSAAGALSTDTASSINNTPSHLTTFVTQAHRN